MRRRKRMLPRWRRRKRRRSCAPVPLCAGLRCRQGLGECGIAGSSKCSVAGGDGNGIHRSCPGRFGYDRVGDDREQSMGRRSCTAAARNGGGGREALTLAHHGTDTRVRRGERGERGGGVGLTVSHGVVACGRFSVNFANSGGQIGPVTLGKQQKAREAPPAQLLAWSPRLVHFGTALVRSAFQFSGVCLRFRFWN